MTVDQYSVGLGSQLLRTGFLRPGAEPQGAALEKYLATREARRTVQISLIAGVAAGYLNLGADRELLQLARDTLAAQQATYEMIRRRFEVGVSSELDLRQAQTRWRRRGWISPDIPPWWPRMRTPLPCWWVAPLTPDLLPTELVESPLAGGEIAPGLSSEVLLRRPDVLQAEETLKGFNANIGAARAAFFPKHYPGRFARYRQR